MKNTSCSQGKSNFGTFWVVLLSFLVLSLLVQSCRLNQNVLAQAVSMNQRGQSETNRLNLPDREVADKPSFKSFISQSENMFPTSIGDQQLKKSEVIRKTAILQMPFIANEGQTDEKVAFYADTFGGTVFVTEDGEIVYALPASRSGELGDKRSEARSQKLEVGIQNADTRNQHKNHQTANSKSETQNLNPQSEIRNPKSEIRSVALKEQFVGAKVKTIQGEEKSVTKVNYFKGNDPSKWKTNISTYDIVNLGEIYKGIDLKLKAYGNNVEKLFCVKPGANPEQIKIRLSGAKDCGVRNAEITHPLVPSREGINPKSEFRNPKLQINKSGELEVETELGPVKFTKPIAYQEINGKRVFVDTEYYIEKSEVGILRQKARNKRQEARSRKQETGQIGKRLISSREKGMGRKGAHLTTTSQLSTENLQPKTRNIKLTNQIQNFEAEVLNPKSKIPNPKLEYGFTVASYDKTKDLIIDPLLASTFLGGSSYNYANVIAVDSSGDIYVAGNTSSSDFPITTGAYDTAYNGSDSYGSGDTFVSKLNGDLASLIASTYLGGSSSEYANSIAVDKDGNIYVSGYTLSADFPAISSCYDTSYNGGDYGGDAFVSKLNGNLTSLMASTYVGGTNSDYSYSIAIDSNGNICMTGQTDSSDFPITTGTYDTSSDPSGYNDAFVSRLNSDLTTLLASTFLGGTNGEGGNSITIDTDGNIYVTGWTSSSNFPTTTDAYDTSYNGNDYTLGDGNYYGHDIFVSKLNSDLTNLLASTYLGGSEQDYVNSIAIDSGGDIYVAGRTWSSNFPTTSGAYDTSYAYNGQTEAYVSKLNGDLTSLLASTYLGGNSYDEIHSIVINSEGNIYVTGGTYSSGFPTTSGAYDTYSHSDSDGGDAFVSKLDGTLSNLLASTFLGGSGGDDLGSSIAIDSSGNIYVAGYTYSIDFPATTGAYDTSYNGDENSHYDAFVSKLDSNLSAGGNVVPAPTPSPKPSYPVPGPTMPSPSPTPEVKVGKILGYVLNIKGNHVESVKLKLKGINLKVLRKTVSDEDGLFEFTDLDADTYIITALKKGYKTVKQTIMLGAGEERDIEIVMKKIRRK